MINLTFTVIDSGGDIAITSEPVESGKVTEWERRVVRLIDNKIKLLLLEVQMMNDGDTIP
jgi:hypothetical protein